MSDNFSKKLYEYTGIDSGLVKKRYGKKALIGAGLIGAGIAAIPSDERAKLKAAVTRDRKEYRQFDRLSDMMARTVLPDELGNIVGGLAGGVIGYKMNPKATKSKVLKKVISKSPFSDPNSVIMRPLAEKATERFGPNVPRAAVGAFLGSQVGAWGASIPFDATQAKRDYQAGKERYGNKLQAGIAATSPWTYNASLYAADKVPSIRDAISARRSE